jgi:hypothetical protein
MSVSSLISDLKTKIFGQPKQKLSKNIPKINNEYIPELEACEGGFNRRLKQRQLELELYSIPKDWDPEKCDESIICGEVIIDINGYEKCKIIENYTSFMENINYFVTPISERETIWLPFTIDDTLDQSEYSLSCSQIYSDDNIDTPLNLCVSSVL